MFPWTRVSLASIAKDVFYSMIYLLYYVCMQYVGKRLRLMPLHSVALRFRARSCRSTDCTRNRRDLSFSRPGSIIGSDIRDRVSNMLHILGDPILLLGLISPFKTKLKGP